MAHSLHLGGSALLLGSIILLIRASIPKSCMFLKRAEVNPGQVAKRSWFSLDRSSLIFSGFRISVVSFRLTASGGSVSPVV